MATLTGRKIKDTYKDLLQISNSNAGIDGTLRTITDGEATTSVLQLSSSAVNIASAGALQYAGTAITATAAELNVLDGITATVAEFESIPFAAAKEPNTDDEDAEPNVILELATPYRERSKWVPSVLSIVHLIRHPLSVLTKSSIGFVTLTSFLGAAPFALFFLKT